MIINKYPKKHRELFVEHENKEIIDISFGEDFEFNSDNINKFVSKVNNELSKRVKNNFINIVNQNFTTTTTFDKMLYNLSTMISMKEYFEYELSVSCGIKKIYFAGELEDWEKILLSLYELEKNFG